MSLRPCLRKALDAALNAAPERTLKLSAGRKRGRAGWYTIVLVIRFGSEVQEFDVLSHRGPYSASDRYEAALLGEVRTYIHGNGGVAL